MKLTKFISVIVMTTTVALIYIHMQMQIFDLAYQGKMKEKRITHLNDNIKNLSYHIMELKSANNLGRKLLANNSEWQFREDNQVVQMMSTFETKEIILASTETGKRRVNPFLSFFSLISQAEAKPVNRNLP